MCITTAMDAPFVVVFDGWEFVLMLSRDFLHPKLRDPRSMQHHGPRFSIRIRILTTEPDLEM